MWKSSKYIQNVRQQAFTKFEKKVNVLNNPEMLIFDFVEVVSSQMSPLDNDENIAERVKLNPQKRKLAGTGLKILTPNKLSTRLPMLLAEIKAGNSSCKLKMKSD